MGESVNTLQERNDEQKKTILKQVTRIQELELWEKFAAHLVNNCIGETVTQENLDKWMADCQKRRTS